MNILLLFQALLVTNVVSSYKDYDGNCGEGEMIAQRERHREWLKQQQKLELEQALLDEAINITANLKATIDQCIGTEQPGKGRFRIGAETISIISTISSGLSITSTLVNLGLSIFSLAKDASNFGDFLNKVIAGPEKVKEEMIKRFEQVDKTLVNIMKGVQDIPEKIRVQGRMLKYQKDRDSINAVNGAYATYIQNINKDQESQDYAYKHLLKTCDSHDLKNWFDILNADFREDFGGTGNLAQTILDFSGHDRLTFISIANWIKKDICAAQFLLVACSNARNISWTVHENNHQRAVTVAYENYKKSFEDGDKYIVENASEDIEKYINENKHNITYFGTCDVYKLVKPKFYWLNFSIAGYQTSQTNIGGNNSAECTNVIRMNNDWEVVLYYWGRNNSETVLVDQLRAAHSLVRWGADMLSRLYKCWSFDARAWYKEVNGLNRTAMIKSANTDIPNRWDGTQWAAVCGDEILVDNATTHMIWTHTFRCGGTILGDSMSIVFFIAPDCSPRVP